MNSVARNARQVGNRQTTSPWRQLLISRVRVAKRRSKASSKRTTAAANSVPAHLRVYRFGHFGPAPTETNKLCCRFRLALSLCLSLSLSSCHACHRAAQDPRCGHCLLTMYAHCFLIKLSLSLPFSLSPPPCPRPTPKRQTMV